MISAVRARAGDAFDLHLADAAALPFPDASFDRVLSVNTIDFWRDPARVLAEMSRVLGRRRGLPWARSGPADRARVSELTSCESSSTA